MEGEVKDKRKRKQKQKEMRVERLIYFAFPTFKISHAYLKFLNNKEKIKVTHNRLYFSIVSSHLLITYKSFYMSFYFACSSVIHLQFMLYTI